MQVEPAQVKTKAGYIKVLAAMPKGVPACGLVLNHTCCINLIVYVVHCWTQ